MSPKEYSFLKLKELPVGQFGVGSSVSVVPRCFVVVANNWLGGALSKALYR